MPGRLPRLTRRSEFLRVAGTGPQGRAPGPRAAGAAGTGGEALRLGFTATKKIGNAVVRNRAKRRLREAARLTSRPRRRAGLGPGADRPRRDRRRGPSRSCSATCAARCARRACRRRRRPPWRGRPARGRRRAARGAVLAYQWTLRPVLGCNCRFHPSCSDYALEALRDPRRAARRLARGAARPALQSLAPGRLRPGAARSPPAAVAPPGHAAEKADRPPWTRSASSRRSPSPSASCCCSTSRTARRAEAQQQRQQQVGRPRAQQAPRAAARTRPAPHRRRTPRPPPASRARPRRGCRSKGRACRARCRSAARGSTTWCCATTARRSSPTRRWCGMLAPREGGAPYYAQWGWTAADGRTRVPGNDTDWQAEGGRLAPGSPVTLRWDNGQGQVFEIAPRARRELHGHRRAARAQHRRRAGVRAALGAHPARAHAADRGLCVLHEGFIGVLNGRLRRGDLRGGQGRGGQARAASPSSRRSAGGWAGFTDKYWLTALAPVDQSRARPRHLPRHQSRGRAAPRTAGRWTSRRPARMQVPAGATGGGAGACASSPAPRR